MVGALGTFVGTSITQRYHERRDLLATQIARRETLYSDFITGTLKLNRRPLSTSVTTGDGRRTVR